MYSPFAHCLHIQFLATRAHTLSTIFRGGGKKTVSKHYSKNLKSQLTFWLQSPQPTLYEVLPASYIRNGLWKTSHSPSWQLFPNSEIVTRMCYWNTHADRSQLFFFCCGRSRNVFKCSNIQANAAQKAQKIQNIDIISPPCTNKLPSKCTTLADGA